MGGGEGNTYRGVAPPEALDERGCRPAPPDHVFLSLLLPLLQPPPLACEWGGIHELPRTLCLLHPCVVAAG